MTGNPLAAFSQQHGTGHRRWLNLVSGYLCLPRLPALPCPLLPGPPLKAAGGPRPLAWAAPGPCGMMIMAPGGMPCGSSMGPGASTAGACATGTAAGAGASAGAGPSTCCCCCWPRQSAAAAREPPRTPSSPTVPNCSRLVLPACPSRCPYPPVSLPLNPLSLARSSLCSSGRSWSVRLGAFPPAAAGERSRCRMRRSGGEASRWRLRSPTGLPGYSSPYRLLSKGIRGQPQLGHVHACGGRPVATSVRSSWPASGSWA